MVTPLNEMPGLLPEAPTGTAQLEWPQEIVSLLEVSANSVDLVNQILYADDAILPKTLKRVEEWQRVDEWSQWILHITDQSRVDCHLCFLGGCAQERNWPCEINNRPTRFIVGGLTWLLTTDRARLCVCA